MSRVSARPAAAFVLAAILALGTAAGGAQAAAPTPGPPLHIERAHGPIVIDGNLDDPGWQGIVPDTVWFETRVADSAPAFLGNRAWLAYDDRYFYAAFQFDDPHPELIRAPLGDHDNLNGSTDYGGILVDSGNDGKTARMFLANPRGLQYDAVSSDVSGEDSSPDWFWDAAGRITATGWNLEIRVPFSSLRYGTDSTQTWGLLLYRNYPRDQHYQFFSARLPREVSCFICNSSKLSGLADLPHAAHLVVAPFSTLQRSDRAASAPGPLADGPVTSRKGFDLKWSPLADLAVDGTLKPDFSQVESDVAQIGANQRFALFYPEKRPFFLEGIDLFATPFQAVYTRTINAPEGGLRVTGKAGTTSFTALSTRDEGGGLVVMPGPEQSGFAFLDTPSTVSILRLRRDVGQSFVSALVTDREIDGGAYNRVFGPDFEWHPRPTDKAFGQMLWSASRTPNAGDPGNPEWNGQRLEDRAFLLNYNHTTRTTDLFAQGMDLGSHFRANEGFIPQVGYREAYFQGGYTIRPEKQFFTRVRFWTVDWYDQEEPTGLKLTRRLSAGLGADGRLSSFTRLELNYDEIRTRGVLLSRFQPRLQLQVSPGKLVNYLSLDSYFGQEIDFRNARRGTGVTLVASATLLPNPHLELKDDASGQQVNIDPAGGSDRRRLFTAAVERLRATWMFNARSYLRLIGQYVVTTRDTTLYPDATLNQIPPRSAAFTGSALFAYKLNWQTVLFAGYGDDWAWDPTGDRMARSGRDFFLKVSYAWQR